MATLGSPSSRRAWIEITIMPTYVEAYVSPSSRRAWIEIDYLITTQNLGKTVALLAEGVDRNRCRNIGKERGDCRPPRGGRG